MTLAQDDVRRTATVDGLTINYYDSADFETGAEGLAQPTTGPLPLVMLHGGGPGASAWSNFGAALPGFAKDFRTILVDQPGFGGSDKPPVEGNYYRFAASYVVGLLDKLGIDRCHLLGNSLGGGTAMRLALEHPERVARLVLMGPGGLSLNLFHADPTEGVKRLMEFGADPTREALKAFISTMVVNQALVTDELVEERFADATAPGSREAMASMGASFWNPDTFEDGMLWREAYKLRQHTLLTWGREDRVNPLDGALVALKLIPKAQLHVFPNCGHWAQIEAAEEFRQVTTQFLDNHVERAK
ncbi:MULTISPECIES: 4,5:9,10-diseco-3-hydroxy-5,9,17-trioxoandrosta-1(10),2-diene-4-oate hydrolase [unclassified Nocardioides]|uniref:4,5:9,10-diseco-3-hydroxy-5,9, 17-trioxoandrosta-1(10),2-diene-4-oate hydrolase n=1 Tax=unclassified Nocardioides TaxID=2615069 RepID=UPI0006FE92BB|nr:MULTISPECIES: 4,5:9,10-diseco-3-hydroxy-5,9,17-trioxoandrosta-1(10),2-diene-4-oate hydrolase [unclassified Nocardioides]KQY64302.1 4,5-9,10-diseco-3-hydroxy-5,9,17-trioxoandrosta-1(10),2-diene-4-oate hydrolase [Nocardioides sp. Root140]KQZ70221.1 4,5-9,10-diseco-3-hydroxy-5,9,17-trioxoandrosta-1(10),2-diene-4-oate hydrolase [Nocardioides sp. Root151]KRF16318.1 4,5-9,10-diseco-3-hydroxy-5,9,17-trioxoandrosta-1(10),2-diene-4-oate hydrolase [Nocardioides sp. Soil796]